MTAAAIHMQVCRDGAHHKLLGTWPQSSSRFNLTRHQLWGPLHFSKVFRLQYMVSTFSFITTKLNLLTGLLAAGIIGLPGHYSLQLVVSCLQLV
jgi:hypothetical protein